MAFSATEAGLEGFRITRENPRAFARWVFFSFAVSVLGAVVTVAMPAEVRSAVATLSSKDTPDLAKLGEAMLASIPLMIMGLTIQSMMAAAVYRIILRHDDARFGYLRLGMDELRLMGLTLLIVLLGILSLMVLTIAVALLAAVASVAGEGVAYFVGFSAEVFAIGILIYCAVRLSLAPVATFAERRFVVFESWKLTKGYFWRLLGAYVLAVACIVVVALLTLVVFTAIAGAIVLSTGGQLSDLSVIFSPDETSWMAYVHPGMIAYTVVGSVITALYYAVIAAPGAVAYQKLHGPVLPPAPAAPAPQTPAT
jgi:hypothetical protein